MKFSGLSEAHSLLGIRDYRLLLFGALIGAVSIMVFAKSSELRNAS